MVALQYVRVDGASAVLTGWTIYYKHMEGLQYVGIDALSDNPVHWMTCYKYHSCMVAVQYVCVYEPLDTLSSERLLTYATAVWSSCMYALMNL